MSEYEVIVQGVLRETGAADLPAGFAELLRAAMRALMEFEAQLPSIVGTAKTGELEARVVVKAANLADATYYGLAKVTDAMVAAGVTDLGWSPRGVVAQEFPGNGDLTEHLTRA